MQSMIFRFRKTASRKHSLLSGASSKRHNKQDANVTTVESWNELRKIGSEAKQPRALESVLKGAYDDDVTLQEVQDWDFYIAQFNEQYRYLMKQPVQDEDKDSISTLADSRSQLLQGRYRRMLVFRKCFIFSCLFLWCICFYGAHEWYLTYLIYPIGFLDDMDESVLSKYFTPRAVWYAFILNAHGWAVANFGLLCAFCFRESPGLLKQFILRTPYMLAVPSLLIFVSVRFVGTFSSQKLKKAMDKKIPEYHNFENDTELQVKTILNNSGSGRRLWDQLQKILQCCGVEGSKDWDSVDTDLTDDVSYWPATCCPKPFIRRDWTKERPNRDDCFYKLNNMERTDQYEWAYPEGCLNLAYEFFVKLGAFVVGLMVANFCALCLCFIFAYKYYTMIRKCEELKFKYSWKQWFVDIFFLSHFKWVTRCFKKCCNACKKPEKPKDPGKTAQNKSFASGHLSQASADSTTLIVGEPLKNVPSVIITAPKEGEGAEMDDQDAISSNALEVLSRDDPDMMPKAEKF